MDSTLDENQSSNVLRRNVRSTLWRYGSKASILACPQQVRWN